VTTEDQKVRLATHMLAEEVEFCWMNASGIAVSWDIFKEEFMRKYFPTDVKSRKEIEFLELKQGSMSVAKYASKFEELSRVFLYINEEGAEASKCIKFESGLRPEIYQYMWFHEIRDFATLMNKCRMFDEACKAKKSFYKMVSDNKGKGCDRGKPYGKDKGEKNNFGCGSKPSRGDSRCYTCGGSGHYANECKKGESCYKCGKTGHRSYECKSKEIVCYNCKETGHISAKCMKPKKAGGKVFVLNVEESQEPNNLIRVIWFINSTPLITIIDTGAPHSFISLGCAERLTKSVTFSKRVDQVGEKILTAG